MIKRHRNAEPVAVAKADTPPDKKAIVENIVMRQRCAFGQAGRAAGELNVDRITTIKALRRLGQKLPVFIPRERGDFVKTALARTRCAADLDHMFEMREPR